MNPLFLYILAILSVFYEFIVVRITFREYFTWRSTVIWILLVTLCAFTGSVIDKTWPNVPLVLINIVPLVLLSAYLLHRLLAVKFTLTLPIILLLNAAKRFVGGVFGVLIKDLFQASQPPIYLRTNLNWHVIYQFVNLIGSEILSLPVIILMGFWGHYLVTKYSFTNFMHHAQVDGYDNLIVSFSLIIYTFIFYYDTQWSLGWQAFTTALLSMSFGALDIYLVMNKNTQLSDTNLLREMNDYNELLKSRNQELHTFRHDYQNILLSMSEYLKKDDLQGLRNYFDNAIQPVANGTKKHNYPEILRLINSSDVIGILYAKYTNAQIAGVQTDISIANIIHIPPVNQLRLIRILGALLDNALIVAKQSNQQIGLLVEQLDKDVRFTITSQLGTEKSINLSKLEHQRFDSNGAQFGISLNAVKQLTTKQIVINYEIRNQLFISQVLIKAKK